MQSSSTRQPFPGTPSRGLYASQLGGAGASNTGAEAGPSINNKAGGSYARSTTPARRSTLTPSRYIPPSPIPGLNDTVYASSSQSQSQSQLQGAGGIGSSQSTSSSTTYAPIISFQDPKYRVLANNADLKAAMEYSQNNVDAALKNLKHGKSERRRAVEGFKVELLEEERRWESECERLRKDGADVVKTLEREKGEITDATTKLSQLENRKRSFAAQLEALKSELNEWSTKLDEIKERNAKARTAFQSEAKKDAPQLSLLQRKLGLRIEGRPNNIVAFSFNLLDLSDHQRVFSIHLDTTESDYSIPVCKPSIPPSELKSMLAHLNEGRDLYDFLKITRRAFVRVVETEEKERQARLAR